ncbi:cyclic nucleotide-binding domain-containing protein [Trinickia sp. LjRoot230]|uniref:cyclic nucleotide-binding domain-containing protein n=1 Tax=Trinickia sp. LjRoot230 TaxID=3342288 RepID=UPI003ED01785
MKQKQSTWTRSATPGEVIYSEGFAGDPVIYVISEGKVEISTYCDEKKVVLGTLGKGDFFGEAALLPAEPRAQTAKALTFCQFTVIETSMIEQELERASPLLRHLVRTTIRRGKKKDDLLATYTHADFLPGVVSYAHVLALMASAEATADTSSDGWGRRGQPEEVAVTLPNAIKKFRAIAGHSRPHVMTMLRRMEKLNLVTLDIGRAEHLANNGRYAAQDGATARQVIKFDPARIIERAQQVGDHDLDVAINSELELIELSDLETLIGVEKRIILNKLSHGEIAEDLFAFRKTQVLNYVEQKGINYFTRRNARPSGDMQSLDDLESVDQRTLFEAVSATDTYDLAKLLATLTDPVVAQRLQSVMTEARKKEVSWVMRREIKIDPLEVNDIEQRFIEAVRTIRASAGGASAQVGREA